MMEDELNGETDVAESRDHLWTIFAVHLVAHKRNLHNLNYSAAIYLTKEVQR